MEWSVIVDWGVAKVLCQSDGRLLEYEQAQTRALGEGDPWEDDRKATKTWPRINIKLASELVLRQVKITLREGSTKTQMPNNRKEDED